MKNSVKTKIHSQNPSANYPAKPGQSRPLASAPGLARFLQKTTAKSAYQPSASARRRLRVTGCSPKSGKAPCRSTGKANFNMIARASAKGEGPLYTAPARASARLRRALASGFVTLLAGKRASIPPKPCHHQSQRYTRSVMPLARKGKRPASPNENTQPLRG